MWPASGRSRLFESRVILDRVLEPEPDEPTEKQIMFHPLHQRSSDRIE